MAALTDQQRAAALACLSCLGAAIDEIATGFREDDAPTVGNAIVSIADGLDDLIQALPPSPDYAAAVALASACRAFVNDEAA